MSEPFLGEVRMFGGNFAPVGWMFCAGQVLPISQYDALFSLIGTIYGGDGQSTFALPDLRGRAPIHQGTRLGQTFVIGQTAGTETVTLIAAQLPPHQHLARAATSADSLSPAGKFWSTDAGASIAAWSMTPSPNASMSGNMVAPAGGNQPHENMQPFLAVSYIIAVEGIYPSQS